MVQVLEDYRKSFLNFIVLFSISLSLILGNIVQAGFDSWEQIVAAGREQIVIDIGNAAMRQGFNYESTIGVLANINSESTFDPSLIEAGNGIGLGLIQWSFERRTALEQFINEKYNGDFKSMEGQMAFLNYEITETSWKDEMNKATVQSQLAYYGMTIESDPPNSWDEFKKLTNPVDAAKIFMAVMERPSASIDHSQRIHMAEILAEKLKGRLDGKPSSDNSSSKDNKVSNVGDGSEGLPAEWDLVGMTKRNYLYESQLQIELPKEGDLSIAMTHAATNLKETNQQVNTFDYIKFTRTLVAFVGIWFIVYAITLLVVYVFDRSNILFEISLLSILTLGRASIYQYDDGETRQATLSTVMQMMFISLLVALVLITGAVYDVFSLLF